MADDDTTQTDVSDAANPYAKYRTKPVPGAAAQTAPTAIPGIISTDPYAIYRGSTPAGATGTPAAPGKQAPTDFSKYEIPPQTDTDVAGTSAQTTAPPKPLGGWWPDIGATVGGIAGGLTSEFTGPAGPMAGATLGAGAGSMLEQKLMGQPINWQQTSDVALQHGAAPELFGQATNKFLGFLFKGFRPTRLYQSALGIKRGTSQAAVEEGEKAARAGLAHGIEIGPGALERATEISQQIGDQVDKIISSSPADIPPKQYVGNIQQRLNALRDKFGRDPDEGEAFKQQIDDIERHFLLNHGNVQPIQKQVPGISNLLDRFGNPIVTTNTITTLPEDMSLAELRANARPLATGTAQGIKQQAWDTISRYRASSPWGQDLPLPLETKQELGTSLMQDLNQIYPGLEKTNAGWGEVIALKDALQHRALQKIQEDLRGGYMPEILGGGVGAGLEIGGHLLATGHPGGLGAAGVGLAAGAYGAKLVQRLAADPLIKSRIALALYRASKRPGMGLVRGVAKQLPAAAYRYTQKIATDPETLQRVATGQAKGGLISEPLRNIERRALSRDTALAALRGARLRASAAAPSGAARLSPR